MKLTRRDALAVLGTLATGGGAAAIRSDEEATAATDRRVDAATAVAEVVYPSAATVERGFVETFLFGRVEPVSGHFDGLAAAIDRTDRFARSRHGGRLPSLSPAERRDVLESMGVYAVHADPDGTTAERVRHYLVNDLLYALFTHPKGGDLLGVPNPPGYPGGNEVYQRGPSR
jgi:hypothetical protein